MLKRNREEVQQSNQFSQFYIKECVALLSHYYTYGNEKYFACISLQIVCLLKYYIPYYRTYVMDSELTFCHALA